MHVVRYHMRLQQHLLQAGNAADDESSAADAGSVSDCVVFELPRIDMLAIRGKIRLNRSDQQALLFPLASNGWPQKFR